MGFRPLVAQFLPLADLHHFCLTKGFHKTHSADLNAICILNPLDCAWTISKVTDWLQRRRTIQTAGEGR